MLKNTNQRPAAILHSDASILIPMVLASVAIILPALLAFNLPPSATFLNQAAALIGWGVFTTWAAGCLTTVSAKSVLTEVWPALIALTLMGCSVLIAAGQFALPPGLALSSIGLLFAAILVTIVAAALRYATHGEQAFRAFAIAIVLAGMLSLCVALIQYFIPQWADGDWIARAATPGRAGGNLRQPNHLSSLLLWALAALVFLHDRDIENRLTQSRQVVRGITAMAVALLVFGVVLTVSRTGAVCVLLLALWGVVDTSLSRFSRVLLWVAPLVYVLCWLGVAEWARVGVHAFAGETQLHGSDPSSSRFGIWANTLVLIGQNPWFGVGWGEFNFAWTLTPFPGRPSAFFDHTHNLPLQLLVELGIPLGMLVLSLLGFALYKAFVACRRASEAERSAVRCSFLLVLMMVVHSMLEYPLWYAYFLLPTAFALGICLSDVSGQGRASADRAPRAKALNIWLPRVLAVSSMVLTVGAAASVVDYMRVAAIFAPREGASSLSMRISEGRRSWFFAHHADYALATTSETAAESVQAFQRAPHYLLDTRLMIAWARALNERGDTDRARYLVQRLKEFRNEQASEFFAECLGDGAKLNPPFQCVAPKVGFDYRDFRR